MLITFIIIYIVSILICFLLFKLNPNEIFYDSGEVQFARSYNDYSDFIPITLSFFIPILNTILLFGIFLKYLLSFLISLILKKY